MKTENLRGTQSGRGGKSHTHIMTPRGTEPENGGRGNHSNLQGREKQM